MRTRLLSELVQDDHYIVDERAVAEAIVARTLTRRLVPEARFRNEISPAARRWGERPPPRVRSFRLCSSARSFHRAHSRRMGVVR
ncbi:MAG TPA: hypothetical protein VHX88_11035 [Solirubrobacteraceae bacterium]|jgi:hypothetical protein|nr:hypothetical protein [Solirubrobacteraceae bacterium]